MTEHSLPLLGEAERARLRRATEIVREHGREIAESAEGAVFRVPSGSTGNRYYVVSLSRGVCECGDFEHRSLSCKHIFAAFMVKDSSATCADCGGRFLRADTVEVHEEHESMLWYPGDRLCCRCALSCGVL